MYVAMAQRLLVDIMIVLTAEYIPSRRYRPWRFELCRLFQRRHGIDPLVLVLAFCVHSPEFTLRMPPDIPTRCPAQRGVRAAGRGYDRRARA